MRSISSRTTAALALALTVTLVGACTDTDPTSSVPTTEPFFEGPATNPPEVIPTEPDDSAPTTLSDEAEAYCQQIEALSGERPEDYVGSEEHRADVSRLIDIAPDDVRDNLTIYSDYLDSGAINPEDPSSKDVENWPPEVQQAIAEIGAYNETTC